MTLEFSRSEPLTMGIELELMILSTHDWDLMRGAGDLLALIDKNPHPGDIKPEITESMIEISTAVHGDYREMLVELSAMRDAVIKSAQRLNLAIAGGGAHPFQHWSEQRIFPKERFYHLHEMYGYLAKQFTVFGQHIHIGVPSGDDAIYLAHMMSRYIPHFIALSASSPFSQGMDTDFDSSRLNNINAFPLSGTMPFVRDWDEFNAYFDTMRTLQVVETMKDFYWDIRPKPEFGTIEIRVCDTPLTVEKAAVLGAYAQALARHLMLDRPREPSQDVYRVYSFNRFTACRYGMQAGFIDAYARSRRLLKEDIAETLDILAPHALALGSGAALAEIGASLDSGQNDSGWLRDMFKQTKSLSDVVRLQSRLWAGEQRSQPDR
ncbi:MAG TPA: YbdK family carboxylate-amine ligase [Burkholderiales bacterium]|nr:YbdK family carboxylate-amine ligase [Burkholderiales bacterium]